MSAAVFFSDQRAVSAGEILEQLAHFDPEAANRWDFPRGDDLAKPPALVVIDDINFAILSLPAAVMGETLESVVAHSPWWPEADATLRSALELHHIIAPGKPEEMTALQRLERAVILTGLMASIAAMPGALGVHWVESGSAWPAKAAAALKGDPAPVSFWVRTWRFREPAQNGQAGVGLLSRGLRCFTGRELHIHPVPEAESERLVGFGDRLSAYLIKHGPIIADGDTLEFEPGQKIKVRHGEAPGGVPLYEVWLSPPS